MHFSSVIGEESIRRWGIVALVIAFFVAYCPVLSWMEFSNTPENLNVATVMEIRRTGNWLFPTLEGEPRTKKPPLPA